MKYAAKQRIATAPPVETVSANETGTETETETATGIVEIVGPVGMHTKTTATLPRAHLNDETRMTATMTSTTDTLASLSATIATGVTETTMITAGDAGMTTIMQEVVEVGTVGTAEMAETATLTGVIATAVTTVILVVESDQDMTRMNTAEKEEAEVAVETGGVRKDATAVPLPVAVRHQKALSLLASGQDRIPNGTFRLPASKGPVLSLQRLLDCSESRDRPDW